MRLIDADALMEVINRHCYPVQHDMTSIEPGMTLMGILQAIQEQPTIEPERKNGKWILHPEIKNVYGGTVIECSECSEKYVVQHLEDEKYCRNCGAKMEAET